MPLIVMLQSDATTVTNSASGYSAGWFTLALINAGLAQSQGRRGRNWFLLSLLLGPIATLIIVLQYKRP